VACAGLVRLEGRKRAESKSIKKGVKERCVGQASQVWQGTGMGGQGNIHYIKRAWQAARESGRFDEGEEGKKSMRAMKEWRENGVIKVTNNRKEEKEG